MSLTVSELLALEGLSALRLRAGKQGLQRAVRWYYVAENEHIAEWIMGGELWNKLGMFGQKDAIKAQWTTCFPDSEKALHCVRCGKCEAVCPQKLPIRDSLAQLQKELDTL